MRTREHGTHKRWQVPTAMPELSAATCQILQFLARLYHSPYSIKALRFVSACSLWDIIKIVNMLTSCYWAMSFLPFFPFQRKYLSWNTFQDFECFIFHLSSVHVEEKWNGTFLHFNTKTSLHIYVAAENDSKTSQTNAPKLLDGWYLSINFLDFRNQSFVAGLELSLRMKY